MSEVNNIFASVVEHLLQGQVICEYAYESEYQYLDDEANWREVDVYLRRVDRMLKRTLDGTAVFAAYTTLEFSLYRSDVRRGFAETINGLEPLVRWLHMVSSASRSDRPVTAGDVVRPSRLLESIENAPVLCEELDRLSKTKLLSNNQSTPRGQLDAILKRLADNGYLVAKGPRAMQYLATGKWSRLYDVMDFISTHEQLDVEPEPEQEALL